MTETLPSAAFDPTTLPIARKRRIKRGIIASYIHEISGRHAEARSATSADQEKPLRRQPAARARVVVLAQAVAGDGLRTSRPRCGRRRRRSHARQR